MVELQPQALPRAVELIREAARTLGLSFGLLDSEFGHLFELSDGFVSRTLLGGRSPLNDAVAARIADDKYYTGVVLERSGFRVPTSVRCLRPGYFELEEYGDRVGDHRALPFALEHGYPLVVKPNRLSHGRLVQLVHHGGELTNAVHEVWKVDYVALVQTAHEGLDVRLDFLDQEFLVGYTRRPHPASPRAGIDILNLARGAQADVLETLPEAWIKLGRRIGKSLNLRYFGIDFKARGLDSDPDLATVVEVNASPLFVQLYAQGHRELALRAQVRVLQAVWSMT